MLVHNPGFLTLYWLYEDDPSVCLGLLHLMTELRNREACPFLSHYHMALKTLSWLHCKCMRSMGI